MVIRGLQLNFKWLLAILIQNVITPLKSLHKPKRNQMHSKGLISRCANKMSHLKQNDYLHAMCKLSYGWHQILFCTKLHFGSICKQTFKRK